MPRTMDICHVIDFANPHSFKHSYVRIAKAISGRDFYMQRMALIEVLADVAGEIIPQALCSRYGLQIGAYSAPFVRVLMWICAILAWPISKILDYLLGHDQTVAHPLHPLLS